MRIPVCRLALADKFYGGGSIGGTAGPSAGGDYGLSTFTPSSGPSKTQNFLSALSTGLSNTGSSSGYSAPQFNQPGISMPQSEVSQGPPLQTSVPTSGGNDLLETLIRLLGAQ